MDDMRTELRSTLDQFGTQISELSAAVADIRTQLDGLAQASAARISEERDEIAKDVSSVTASVKRELFEARRSGTMARNN